MCKYRCTSEKPSADRLVIRIGAGKEAVVVKEINLQRYNSSQVTKKTAEKMDIHALSDYVRFMSRPIQDLVEITVSFNALRLAVEMPKMISGSVRQEITGRSSKN